MRLFKKTLLAIVYCAIFSNNILIAQSILILPSETCTLRFCWQGDSIHSKWEANVAILIPVIIQGCPRTFYMQFDTGAPYSLIYKNKLNAIQLKYPSSIPSNEIGGKLENFSFKADQTPIVVKEIEVKQFDDSAIDWKDENRIEIIGTIGTDLIDGKVAIIDYVNKKLTVSQSIPERLMENISLSDFIYSNRHILLPAKVNGKETVLYFDTGSSMFELLTDRETSKQLAIPNEKPIQYKVNSWGNFLIANTLASNSSIEIANISIPIGASTFIEGVSNAQIEQMSKMGIGGMTGNKLFLNYILVLDTKHHKFGLLPSLQYSDIAGRNK